MTTINQASDASTETAVTKLDPTLNSIQQERDDAAAERARIQAEREEAWRLSEKRSLLGQVLNMQADIEKRLEAVKAQKKLLKGLKNDLAAVADETDLTNDDLKDLLRRGHAAYHVEGSRPSIDPAIPAMIVSLLKPCVPQGGLVGRGA